MAAKPDSTSPVEAPSFASQTAAIRRRDVVIAGHRGAVDEVRAAQNDEAATVREAVLGALDRLGQLSVHDLRRASADPSAAVRRRACELAATNPDLVIDETVDKLLEDNDATVVELAAWASGERRPHPLTLERLISETAHHEDALVREASVAALGAIGDETGLATILAATTDRATVRRRAIIALAPFDGPEVDAALEGALSDRDWQVRQAAEDLLDAERAAHIGPDSGDLDGDPSDHHY